jgi:RES domain-containing protein
MDGLDEFVEAIRKLPLRRRRGLLARCVSRAALEGSSPPDFLYASTRAGRYNPENVESIYWSQGETVARLEYRRYHKGAQAYETFFCRYYLNVIDLEDTDALSALELSNSDLRAPWRTAGGPTKCQTLGYAVSLQHRFAAIRFPSDAARAAGETGFNYVIFKSSIRDPYFIQVETDPGTSVQRWP